MSSQRVKETQAKMPFYNWSHLKDETPLTYAERHLKPSAVAIIKKHMALKKKGKYYCYFPVRHQRPWYICAEHAEEGRKFYEKLASSHYDAYQRYNGDKRSGDARDLRETWITACVDLLYHEFQVAWLCELEGI